MDAINTDGLIRDQAALDAIYGESPIGAIAKETDHIHPHYRTMIEASPFVVIATSGPEGLDCSPRGDPAGFVHVLDEKTLLIPDRRGNNRIDTLRNIVRDDRIALLFLIPGVGETLRVNGRAAISTAPELIGRFPYRGTLPRSVIIVRAENVYFQCPKALVRSELWNPEKHISRKSLPSTGTILADITAGKVGGEQYDRDYPERLRTTIY
ncbi:pyridoxamine 5'-phosphate oxidase family protein [Acidisphaera sp. S103]|uniref:pyridoxamine 5'-phosphate oxidase family protein n=1 Tax=Acidisphaera sp. S103 TaxID=1747223 RepID=UPI00131D827C|nr:pyridoxamine 5'-phosphate oxidase family protein [Acidisphaera sp. S103]